MTITDEWAHVEREGVACAYVPQVDGYCCACTDPTPDPTGKCGFPDCRWDSAHGYDGNCWHAPRADCHPHVPTRCRSCGHPIEAWY